VSADPSENLSKFPVQVDKEQEVIGAVMARDFNRAIEIRFVRSSRRSPDSQEYIISEIEFSALHTFTLT